MSSRSVSSPLTICTADTRPCPFQDPKRRAFQGRGHAHIRPAAVSVQIVSSVTVVSICRPIIDLLIVTLLAQPVLSTNCRCYILYNPEAIIHNVLTS